MADEIIDDNKMREFLYRVLQENSGVDKPIRPALATPDMARCLFEKTYRSWDQEKRHKALGNAELMTSAVIGDFGILIDDLAKTEPVQRALKCNCPLDEAITKYVSHMYSRMDKAVQDSGNGNGTSLIDPNTVKFLRYMEEINDRMRNLEERLSNPPVPVVVTSPGGNLPAIPDDTGINLPLIPRKAQKAAKFGCLATIIAGAIGAIASGFMIYKLVTTTIPELYKETIDTKLAAQEAKSSAIESKIAAEKSAAIALDEKSAKDAIARLYDAKYMTLRDDIARLDPKSQNYASELESLMNQIFEPDLKKGSAAYNAVKQEAGNIRTNYLIVQAKEYEQIKKNVEVRCANPAATWWISELKKEPEYSARWARLAAGLMTGKGEKHAPERDAYIQEHIGKISGEAITEILPYGLAVAEKVRELNATDARRQQVKELGKIRRNTALANPGGL